MTIISYTRVFLSCIFCCISIQVLIAQADMELVVPTGHTQAVQSLAVSGDGSLIASVDFDPSIILWDYPNRRQLFSLHGHRDLINDLTFSDSVLYSVGRDGKVIRWDLNQAAPASIFSADVEFLAVEVSGNSVYTISGDALYILSATDLTATNEISDFSHELTTLEVDAYTGAILVGDTAGYVTILDLESINLSESAKVSDFSISKIKARAGGGYFVGDERGQVTSVSENFEVQGPYPVMGLRVFDLLPISTDSLLVAGRDDISPVKLVNPVKFREEDTDFSMGSAGSGLLRLGIRCLDKVNDSTILYTLPDGSFVSAYMGPKFSFEVWTGQAAPLSDIKIIGNTFYYLQQNGVVKKIDLSGIRKPEVYSQSEVKVNSFDVDELQRKIATVTADDRILVYNLSDSEIIGEFDIKSRYSNTPVLFDPLAKYVIRKNDSKAIEIFDYSNGSDRKLKVENGFNFSFSFDGLTFFVQSADGIQIFDVPSFDEKQLIKNENIQHFAIREDRIFALEKDDKTVRSYSWSGQQLGVFTLEQSVDKIRILPSDGSLLGYRVSYDAGSQERDYNLYSIDSETGKTSGTYQGHEGFIREVEFFRDGQFIFSAAADGKINIYQKDEFENPRGSIIPLQEENYVTITPSGLYDATPAAMKSLHYTSKGRIIKLDQYKGRFYEPFLLPRLLGIKDDPLPETDIASVAMHPEITYKHPNLNDGKLSVSLTDKGGGIGRVVIIINGKEVSRDIRTKDVSDNLEIEYEIAGHPYLKPAELNQVTIKAFNRDGTMSSPDKNIFVFPDGKKKPRQPKLWALIAGTSDYPGTEMDLRFAAKDARDFAEALEVSARNQFGEENINVSLLTTDNENQSEWPYKENIDSVFSIFAEQAVAGDYLVVYFSGHGLNENDFYYLTPSATDQEIDFIDSDATISSDEITEMIKRVPALQQVLILDACHSGRFANELLQLNNPSTMNIDQVKALERIKDRTGLYVLAGSKADAVSYEAELFEQGLLTYSILFGMKGAALKSGEDVDIMDLFQFVEGKVPELAEEIGGMQKPELRYPNNASSFTIGKMTEADKKNIRIVSSRPIVLLSNFQEENTIADPLRFAQKVNKTLRESDAEGDKFVFLDKENFDGAYRVWGRYRTENDQIIAKIRIFRGGALIKSFEVSGVSSTSMSQEIVAKLVEELD